MYDKYKEFGSTQERLAPLHPTYTHWRCMYIYHVHLYIWIDAITPRCFRKDTVR